MEDLVREERKENRAALHGAIALPDGFSGNPRKAGFLLNSDSGR
jgi:hypothetical protein